MPEFLGKDITTDHRDRILEAYGEPTLEEINARFRREVRSQVQGFEDNKAKQAVEENPSTFDLDADDKED